MCALGARLSVPETANPVTALGLARSALSAGNLPPPFSLGLPCPWASVPLLKCHFSIMPCPLVAPSFPLVFSVTALRCVSHHSTNCVSATAFASTGDFFCSSLSPRLGDVLVTEGTLTYAAFGYETS